MTREEYLEIEIGDICGGKDWRGVPIQGMVIAINKKRATLRGKREMATVHYKKLSLIERDPTSRIRLRLQEFAPMLKELLDAIE